MDAGEAVKKGSMTVTFGLPLDPWDFLEKATELPHPFAQVETSDLISKAIFESLTMGPKRVAEKQQQWFTRWEKRASQLEKEERKFESLHPDLREHAKKMRPLLSYGVLKEIPRRRDVPEEPS